MPRFRFTIRRLMVAVAITGIIIAIGLGDWMERRDRLASRQNLKVARVHRLHYELAEIDRKTAEDIAETAEQFLKQNETMLASLERKPATNQELAVIEHRIVDSYRQGIIKCQGDSKAYRARAEKAARLVDYFGKLARKYEHAARYPRLTVAPDPPEPR